jgi:hypothetical protein
MDTEKILEAIGKTQESKNYMQFSKKVELINKVILIALIFFAAASWFVYHEVPDFVTWVVGASGAGDIAYMVNSAVEKNAKAKENAAIEVASNHSEPGDL